jgi:tRNA1(Val) A37 N6-methylase TrmN6
MARHTRWEHPTLGPLTDDRLTVDYRVWQRKHGHRFSSDDVVTAFMAHQALPAPSTHIDLGTGLGSVLLLLAWKNQEVRSVGIEAQLTSFTLLLENVARNHLAHRVRTVFGDLREPEVLAQATEGFGTFELVTGTPPYFPPGKASDARDRQRTLARIEERGGVEAYIDSACKVLSPSGTFVLCGDSRAESRVRAHLAATPLSLVSQCDVIPRFGRPALFSVWTIRWRDAVPPTEADPLQRSAQVAPLNTFTLRDVDGSPTPDAARLRVFSGFDKPDL